jgi:hypothetical protein
MLKIKIKSNKKKLQEIGRHTPQYKETYRLKSEYKTELDSIFGSRKRIGLILNIKAPTSFGSADGYEENAKEASLMGEMSGFVADFCLEPMKLYKVVYIDIPNNPNEQAKREKLRSLEATNILHSFFKNVSNNDIHDKITGHVESFFSILKELGFKFDLSKRTISGKRSIPNPKSPTGMSPPRSYSLVDFIKKVNAAIKAVDDSGLQRDDVEEILLLKPVQDLKNYFLSVLNLENPDDFLYAKFTALFNFEAAWDTGRTLEYRKFRTIEPIFEKFGYEALTSKNISEMTAVMTRVPIEVVRMSDFSQLKSCHAVGGMYSSCATQEAVSSGGAVVYLFNQKYNPRKLKRLETEEREFLKDPDRNVYGSNPISRIRLRTFKFTFNAYSSNSREFVLSIPTPRMFGRSFSGFYNQIKQYMQEAQKEIISELVKLINDKQRFTLYRYGGGYYEGSESYHLQEFLGLEEDKRLSADETEYPEDFENQSSDNVPDSSEIEDNYAYRVERIISNSGYENVVNFSVNAEVTTDEDEGSSGTGYYSGASEPDPINVGYSVSVTIGLSITTDNLKQELAAYIVSELEKIEESGMFFKTSTAVKMKYIDEFINSNWFIDTEYKKTLESNDFPYSAYHTSDNKQVGEFENNIYLYDEEPYEGDFKNTLKQAIRIAEELSSISDEGYNGITQKEYEEFIEYYGSKYGPDKSETKSEEEPEKEDKLPDLNFEPYEDDYKKPEKSINKKNKQLQEIRHRFKTLIGK